jgi:hypothetical protein
MNENAESNLSTILVLKGDFNITHTIIEVDKSHESFADI